jgi:hypothetical protein
VLITGVLFLRQTLVLALLAVASVSVRADDILFIGNSFTFAAEAPLVRLNGGVPKLVEEIAMAKGKSLTTAAVTAGGMDWSYHLAQPATGVALASKTWTWVVLQDLSTGPTRIGNVAQFMKDGETFSDRIEETSPAAGILLYETWARPPGFFYHTAPGNAFSGPAEMMSDLHQSYGRLRDDLAAKDPKREVRVALVGTAFARVNAEYPAIILDAFDHHHATADGYYLAALVIYETIYHDSAKGAPVVFFHGALTIPADDAADLQQVADEVAGGNL